MWSRPTSKITLRATGTVTLFDGFLTLYLEGQDDDSDEDGARLPKVAAGDAAESREGHSGAAFHRAAAALFRSQPGAQAGRTGHRPAFDLCLDPLHLARPRLCAHGSRPLHPGGQGPAGHHLPAQLLPAAMWQYDFTADLEEKLDEVSAGELDWKQLLRDFWKDFSAAVGETKELKIRQVIDELDRCARPAHLPAGEDGADPRKCPACGDGRLNLKLGRFGAFVGCTNYPECKFTRQIGAKPGEGDTGAARAGPVSRHRGPGYAALRPLRALCAAGRRRKAQALRACPRAPILRRGSGDWR